MGDKLLQVVVVRRNTNLHKHPQSNYCNVVLSLLRFPSLYVLTEARYEFNIYLCKMLIFMMRSVFVKSIKCRRSRWWRTMITNQGEEHQNRWCISFFSTSTHHSQSSPINKATILDLFLSKLILAILFESLNSFHSLYLVGSFGPQSGFGLSNYKRDFSFSFTVKLCQHLSLIFFVTYIQVRFVLVFQLTDEHPDRKLYHPQSQK